MRRSESTLIKDDESPEKKRAHHVAKELTAADEFMAFADDIESRRDAAKAQNDVDGSTFYDHLANYYNEQASKRIFTLGPDKDAVKVAVKGFEDAN